ncbi:hypothetical protein GCM10008955_36180 [Deinococcus malanensis]|uniref:Uncharacterized protein n=1 Tax=Deinococcus malanensis TaxID=1706855 RepID=A0ABQ2F459_9DEIO|nr:hypothetical protein GCM10008955_36180 [Deinococcus malanensis]
MDFALIPSKVAPGSGGAVRVGINGGRAGRGAVVMGGDLRCRRGVLGSANVRDAFSAVNILAL